MINFLLDYYFLYYLMFFDKIFISFLFLIIVNKYFILFVYIFIIFTKQLTIIYILQYTKYTLKKEIFSNLWGMGNCFMIKKIII